ncbi:MAG: DUF47 family protein [Chlamydiota bacterium]|nr:DUF47 family protein [Chlamydiota bacterium]
MRSTIARLFNRSPFFHIQAHMKRIYGAMKHLSVMEGEWREGSNVSPLFDALVALTREATSARVECGRHLAKSLFLPIDRHHLLDIVAEQDAVGRVIEEVGFLMTLFPFDNQDSLVTLFKKNREGVKEVRGIIQDIDTWMEAGFGGGEGVALQDRIESVGGIARKVTQLRYEAIRLNREHETVFRYADALCGLAYCAERLAEVVGVVVSRK